MTEASVGRWYGVILLASKKTLRLRDLSRGGGGGGLVYEVSSPFPYVPASEGVNHSKALVCLLCEV